MKLIQEFSADDIANFEPEAKVGIVATISPDGLPHISLLTSIQAKSARQMTIGEFSSGLSKQYMQKNNKVGFLIMNLERRFWQGKANWTHLSREGEDYEMYNNKPMFRYNAYFGINTIHYLDLVKSTNGSKLPMLSIVPSVLLTMISAKAAKVADSKKVLTTWGEKLFNMQDSLKFLAFVDETGYPLVVPVMQTKSAGSNRLVFSPLAFNEQLMKIKPGQSVAVFGMTLAMESVLARGTFAGYSRYNLIKLGAIELDYVYNSMPPGHGQIYPETALKPVQEF